MAAFFGHFVCFQTWRMGTKEVRVFGCWASSIRKLASPATAQVGPGITAWQFQSSPSEYPAFTPQQDDACVSTVWPGPRLVGGGGGREWRGYFSATQAQVYTATNITTITITKTIIIPVMMTIAALSC